MKLWRIVDVRGGSVDSLKETFAKIPSQGRISLLLLPYQWGSARRGLEDGEWRRINEVFDAGINHILEITQRGKSISDPGGRLISKNDTHRGIKNYER